MGFGHTLDDAFQSTLERTINLLVQILGISPEEAYILCSLGVDFRITQVVNSPQKGVHGAIAKSILPETFQFPLN
ncbi:Acetamidase/Formamidase family protein [Limnospira platensis C1]|nr:Acetamidase/Formamidase family protein [Arthrospira platensis C1]